MKPGVYTALITPFTSTGELDEEGLRRNIHFQLENGVDGIFVLGTTGEAPTLSAQEKEAVIRIAREEVKPPVPLIVGTGNYSTARTIAETQRAQDLGADIALVVTPYYNKPTQEGLFRHFEALCKEVKIPILPYNIQGRTGQNLSTDTLKRLAALPQIIGVKEASGSIVQMMEVIEQILSARPDFLVYSGDDNFTMPLIALGGHGILSVVSNLIPAKVVELTRLALAGDFAQARALHYELLPIFRAAFIETNPIPIKAMMHRAGLPAGECRLPLCELLPENRSRVNELIDNMKFFTTETQRKAYSVPLC